jgi:hypothetical protein
MNSPQGDPAYKLSIQLARCHGGIHDRSARHSEKYISQMLKIETQGAFLLIPIVYGILQHGDELFIHQEQTQWEVSERLNADCKPRAA